MRDLIALALALGCFTGRLGEATDRDGDGVSDALEQALSQRFHPKFWVDARECAGLPAQFRSDSIKPEVQAHNATIYVRVSPSTALGTQRAAIELSFYHLWDKDCGPLSPHPLDVEHVAALLVANTPDAEPSEWTALYWYAAAHENTVCDTSNAARAEAIHAVDAGPSVWISAGKHASYLSRKLCTQRGCGVDACKEMIALPQGPLINLGEAGAPAEEAVWIASEAWPLAEKLEPSFDRALTARLEEDDQPVLARVNGQWRPAHFSLSIGGDVVEALDTAGKHGGGSLAKAQQETGSAIGKSLRAVLRALGAVGRVLTGGRKEAEQ